MDAWTVTFTEDAERDMAIPFCDIKARMMKAPEFRAEYDKLAPEFERAAAEINARIAQQAARRQGRQGQVAPIRRHSSPTH